MYTLLIQDIPLDVCDHSTCPGDVKILVAWAFLLGNYCTFFRLHFSPRDTPAVVCSRNIPSDLISILRPVHHSVPQIFFYDFSSCET